VSRIHQAGDEGVVRGQQVDGVTRPQVVEIDPGRGAQAEKQRRRRQVLRAQEALERELRARGGLPLSESAQALMPTFESSLSAAREFLAGLTEDRASAIWRITAGPRQMVAMPRIAVMRTMGLNHWYHHRGELVVYLRLLDVPVPTVYGSERGRESVHRLGGVRRLDRAQLEAVRRTTFSWGEKRRTGSDSIRSNPPI
jgi:hypothetical protein